MDRQLTRQQERLKQQKSQLSDGQAALKRQQSQLSKLTKDTKTTLSRLRREAESAPSGRFILLTQKCEELNGTILSLTVRKTQTIELVEAASESLSQLDSEIIEADAIYKEILDKIRYAKQLLLQTRHDTTFQVAIEADLKNSIADLKETHKTLEASLIHMRSEQERITSLSKDEQSKLDEIINDINRLSPERQRLREQVNEAGERLGELDKESRLFQTDKSQEELRLQRKKRKIKAKNFYKL